VPHSVWPGQPGGCPYGDNRNPEGPHGAGRPGCRSPVGFNRAQFGDRGSWAIAFGQTSASALCSSGGRSAAVQAAFSRLRIASAWLALIRPTAIASITTSARQQRVYIFVSPRMVCFSNPKLVSKRLLTRSTAVRLS
jgi:hypothetical protein